MGEANRRSIDDNPPGLLSREFFRDGDEVTVIEHWNPNVPGCPFVVIKLGTFERVEGVREAVRRRVLSRLEAEALNG